MGIQQTIRQISAVAAGVLAQYRFVAFDSAGEVDYPTLQGRVDGVTQEAADAQGKVIGLAIPDGAIVKIEAVGVIAVGGQVAADAAGKAIALGAANGNLSWGTALDLGAAGSIIRIQFKHNGQTNA